VATTSNQSTQSWYEKKDGFLIRYERGADGTVRVVRTPISEITDGTAEKKTARKSWKHKSKNIVRWGDFKFSVTPKDIVGVRDISLSGSCETEEKESGGEKYVKLKNRKPIEFTVKVLLNAYLTEDVKGKTVDLITTSTKGQSNYLYLGNEKLLTPRFMLTAAKAGKVTIAAGNTWVSSEIELTFRQSTKYDGTKSKSKSKKSGGSKKKSTKTRGTKSTTYPADSERKKQMKEAKERAVKEAQESQQEAKRQSHHDAIRAKTKKVTQPTDSGRRMSGATM